jgi:hypothetical protein
MHSRWFQRLMRAGLCLAVVIAGSAAQAMSEASRFPGAWRLISAEYRSADGTVVDSPWGPEPQGMLIYDSYGHMAAQLGRRDRAPFAGGDQLRGSADEVKAAFESYNAYWGRYEVDEHARTVTHHVEQAMFPNWTGSKQLRYYKLEATRLILTTPPIRRGGQEVIGVLVWERIR